MLSEPSIEFLGVGIYTPLVRYFTRMTYAYLGNG